LKKEQLKKNTIFYSTRFNCFGQCLGVKDFMGFMIWSKPTAPMGWYPSSELIYDMSEIKDNIS
jgi:hypothetical protein